MKRSALLQTGFTLLLLLNLSLLAFIFFGPHPHPGRPGMEGFDQLVIHTLKLNDGQIHEFNRLKADHRDKMVASDEKMRALFERYFSTIGEHASLRNDSIGQVIGEVYRQKITDTYVHFEDLKRMCTPLQKKEFSRLVPELMQVITPVKNLGPPPEGIQDPDRIKGES